MDRCYLGHHGLSCAAEGTLLMPNSVHLFCLCHPRAAHRSINHLATDLETSILQSWLLQGSGTFMPEQTGLHPLSTVNLVGKVLVD